MENDRRPDRTVRAESDTVMLLDSRPVLCRGGPWTVAEIAYLEDGRIRASGRVGLQYAVLQAFARRLRPTDEVVLEAVGNTQAIVAALKAPVAKVVVANPLGAGC